jgi:SAM-dependent methyltransferase
VELREGDALALPLRDAEWGTFDVVHARFLLEHLPDPLAAVRPMFRAVRPGGRVILVDDDHAVFRVTPEPPDFAEVWAEYMRAFERHGNDPLIGRRLVSLLQEGGAAEIRNTCLFFGSCAGSPTFPAAVNNLIGVLEGARDDLLAGAVTPDRLEDVLAGLREWAGRRDAALWYTADWAEGRRRS